MRKILPAMLCLLGAAGFLPAQNYAFQVPLNESHVFVQAAGACRIEYAITFANQGDPIDVVDVGLPNKRYRLNTAEASFDGRPVASIAPSSYISIGVEVKPVEALPGGATGTLTFSILQDGMLYRDDDDKAYASVRFSPTWFGGGFASGTTRYRVHFHFPSAMGPDEPRYHKTEPSSVWRDDGGVVYLYEFDGKPSIQYTFGASLPAQYVVNIQEPPGKVARFFAALGGFIAGSIPCCFFLAIGGLITLGVVASHKRKLKYLPATIGVEGVEVKRGLTVPEVACLMELPVNKVLAAILFGLIKKGRARIVSEKPLRIEPLEAPGDLAVYEAEFLKSIQDDQTVSPKEAEEVMVKLITRTRDAMKGFNRKKTLAYYQSIIAKAWEQMKGSDWQEGFDYLLLDKEADRKLPEVMGGRAVVLPGWWGHYRPTHRQTPAGAGTGGSIPGRDFAHQMASGVEGMANNIVGSVSSLAQKVTGRTNPVPVSSGGGGRSGGGGGGCACACACAGCACACAGGGR
jgi:hypothetical protein